MTPIRYYELRPHQIRAVRDRFPVAYLPMGVLEWHGEHNPVGLDALKATAMAEYFAEHIGGLVMPTVWWGDHRGILAEVVFGPAPGEEGFDHRPGIMRGYGFADNPFMEDAKRSEEEGGWALWEKLYLHTLHEIATLGFKVIVTISGHYPLSAPAARMAEKFNKTGRARVISIIGFDMVKDRFEGDHAAKWETSLMLYLRPELVDMSQLDPDPEAVPIGVMGADPRTEASAEYGRQGMEAMTEALAAKVRQALDAVR